MTALTQALLRALRMVAHGSVFSDLAASRAAFVELRDAALRPGYRTRAVERVCLRALARFHARYSEQARLDVCTVVTFGALMRAALCDAGDHGMQPLEAMAHTMSVVAVAQGTGPLVPRSTLRSTDGHITLGDFQMGPWRHDGRWRLSNDERGYRLLDTDCGRRLARRIATHALEITLGARSGLRDITIAPTAEGYVLSGRARGSTTALGEATIRVTANGIVDWPSVAHAASASHSTASRVAQLESSLSTITDEAA